MHPVFFLLCCAALTVALSPRGQDVPNLFLCLRLWRASILQFFLWCFLSGVQLPRLHLEGLHCKSHGFSVASVRCFWTAHPAPIELRDCWSILFLVFQAFYTIFISWKPASRQERPPNDRRKQNKGWFYSGKGLDPSKSWSCLAGRNCALGQ